MSALPDVYAGCPRVCSPDGEDSNARIHVLQLILYVLLVLSTTMQDYNSEL